MQRTITPTLALIIAGGLAAGIALARPPAAETATNPPTVEAGYLGPIQSPGTDDSGARNQVQVTVADFGFGAPVTVRAGQTVTVVNRDGVPHTVTADSGAFDSGSIESGATGSFVAPDQPGTYQFFCAIHPSMRGELIVQG